MSCTAKTGPLKSPFRGSIGNWLGERETGAQWPPSLNTEEMEMSYWSAALVLLIAMSRRGAEGRGWVSPVTFLKAWFFPFNIVFFFCCSSAAVHGCPVTPCLQYNCSAFEIWWNKIFFSCPGVMIVTLIPPTPLPSWILELPFALAKLFPCSQEGMCFPLLAHTSS